MLSIGRLIYYVFLLHFINAKATVSACLLPLYYKTAEPILKEIVRMMRKEISYYIFNITKNSSYIPNAHGVSYRGQVVMNNYDRLVTEDPFVNTVVM